ncbi:hypothetical protein HDU67_003044 [Dinochytrium kinnereticum]|nr:hypothetical protein HDU67_003044 [Dinochytrium kinnereticum]
MLPVSFTGAYVAGQPATSIASYISACKALPVCDAACDRHMLLDHLAPNDIDLIKVDHLNLANNTVIIHGSSQFHKDVTLCTQAPWSFLPLSNPKTTPSSISQTAVGIASAGSVAVVSACVVASLYMRSRRHEAASASEDNIDLESRKRGFRKMRRR